MSQPQWVTPAGSLGSVLERVLFTFPLQTTNADSPPQIVRYSVVTGSLPPGLTMNPAGLITGLPQVVLADVTSNFTVRAYTDDGYRDRSFSITVVNTNAILWITPVGNLGTIPEDIFYSVQLESTTIVTPPQTIRYRLLSGLMPAGIYIDDTGLISGVPRAVVNIGGVPVEVSQDVTSKFAIRAYTEESVAGETVVSVINDRTFTITVSGAGAPRWLTPPGEIAEYYVGTIVNNLAVDYTDTGDQEGVVVSLFSGELPPGLTVDSKGVFSGYIGLNPLYPGVTPGYDLTPYDIYPYDFTQQSVTYTYQFVLSVSNGFSTDLRTYEITSLSRSMFTADTTLITADTTLFTADVSSVITPFITTPLGSIGTVRSDNFFAYQFQAVNVYGNTLGWEATTPLPPGLTLDLYTGWLYGDIPDLGITDLTYGFNIRVFEIGDPTITSVTYFYSLTIQGDIAGNVTWLTPSNLGTIDNGATSTFYVEAVDTLGLGLEYRIKSGSNSQLPQGLVLETTGEIVGRVGFQTFTIDHGTTTFDVDLANSFYNVNNTSDRPTTFDLTFDFTVEAYSSTGVIIVSQEFSILVNRVYNEPYENLYIKAMPPFASRALISSLVNDTSIFTPDLIYRRTDPNFGVSKSVVYWHAYGLTAATYEQYVSALELNHYHKQLTLGQVKTARAVDPTTGETVYEVVYCDVVDNLVNNDGTSVGKEVVIPYPVDQGTPNEIDVVYPNSLINMRQQVIDTVGQISNILPLWMQSQQSNGTVLGFTPAWVIAYCEPGAANRVAYNIATQFTGELNQFDFTVDRYEIDRALTRDWKPVSTYPIVDIVGGGSNARVQITPIYALPFITGEEVNIAGVIPGTYDGNVFVESFAPGNVTVITTNTDTYISGGNISNYGRWLPNPAVSTTFDIDAHYQFGNVSIATGGTGYIRGDEIVIPGTSLGGVTPSNDVLVVVNSVNGAGAVQGAFCGGIATLPLVGSVYNNITGTVRVGTGVGAGFNFVVVPGVATVFDGGSMTFIESSSGDSSTDAYDRYLVFPKRNILQ